ncbi:I78 family peptidase inhibitor [Paracoccus seriniphilus]|uniref:Peptidase inhibitor I78 family protein n=1 Tax=Paracoccus seriniphilus TaxID=184748 RepID=A0A239PST3_9RHOB|nr:I78 family peptidase inhibitor [Paracoccus seriniphilus]WCR14303.1 hypothetical protein JHW44_02225 [Paracoccus seriniphilus]SNT72992.1 Peptidase inhibitor I78 family protein [Paracoccus seriniphilus]
MRLSFSLLGVLAIFTVAACAPPTPREITPDEPADQCGAAGYKGLIGQPRDILDKMSFPIGTRQIGPEDAVTSDFRPDRLNIEYGSNGRIDSVSCY